MTEHKTEMTIRFARGGLEDLSAAWAFVMEHADMVGGEAARREPVSNHQNPYRAGDGASGGGQS